MNNGNFVASLHTHVRSLYDADIRPNELCERINQLGGKGCAITDHGVLSSIEDYRPVFKDHDLKLIPGVELYVDGGLLGRLHLVLLAVNDRGYKTISKIVTKSNENLKDGFPVTTEKVLADYLAEDQGNVIGLSACMQGVVSAIFLQNDKIDKKISRLKEKQQKYEDPSSMNYFNAQEELKKCEKAVDEATLKRDTCKQCAEQPFSKRERAVEKLENTGAANAAEERSLLEADKKAAEKAKEELQSTKDALDKAKKALSAAQKNMKALDLSVEKFFEVEEEINLLKKELKNDDELAEAARETMARYAEMFGNGNFYAEVQYHGIPEEKICFPLIAKIAKELSVPLVATNDVHILTKSEDERLKRRVLRSLRFGEKFEDENVGDNEVYLKDNDELAKSLSEILSEDEVAEALNNIEVIFDRCDVAFETGKHYPKFSKDGNAEEIFDHEIERGIAWRFPEGLDEEHEERLKYETEIIKSMGYVDYHLVVKDFLEYGRLLGFVPDDKIDEAPLTIAELKEYISQNGWKNGGLTIGPGRGSAVGSLVCYLLGITNLDPLKYGLLFERFLNPERVSMPDIDSDIYSTGRGKVIEYVRNKYGYNSVCGIMTMTMQAPKGSINIAAKYYGFKKDGNPMTALGKIISKDVPDDPGTSFSTTVNSVGSISEKGTSLYEYLVQKYKDNKDALEILRWAKIIEGSFTSYSAHAAGVVISDGGDVSEYLPLRMNTEIGMMTTQCDKEQVEDNGLLKFDFLGLKTLDIITQTIRMIEDNQGKIIDPLKIDLADLEVYKNIFAAGKTNAVFQFESSGMRSMLKRFQPESFEDLIILVSMFRPGPLQYLDNVIGVKNGQKPMTFLCPELKPILGKTYGAIVYQEQVMQICQSLAGFTLGHADQVRRFMSKKKADKLAHEKKAFIDGCNTNGISTSVAEELFSQMMDFASYAFNKSHAAAYAYNAYVTGWLKLHYPAEFFTAALNWTTPKKLAGLMYEAKEFDVDVKAPDINLSGRNFEDRMGVVRFGLASVAGVKNNASAILEERKRGQFTSLKDFLVRVNPNIRVASNLIDAGAFDEFSRNRSAMKQMTEEIKDLVPKIIKKKSFIASAEFVLPQIESLKDADELVRLQEENGLKAEITDLTSAESLEKRIATARGTLQGLEKELLLVREPRTSEDKTQRMNAERELLGIYVTEHPMDFYPSCEELASDLSTDMNPVSIPALNDVSESTVRVYGVISNLNIKGRKSDGAKMAFFNLEDRSGSIEVSCFTKEFANYGKLLKEGNVVMIQGNCIVDTYDEGDDIRTELKFVAKKISTVEGKKCSYVLSVPSYAAFFINAEEEFIARYADENGHKLLIHDRALNEMREFKHKVSSDVKVLQNIEEYYT